MGKLIEINIPDTDNFLLKKGGGFAQYIEEGYLRVGTTATNYSSIGPEEISSLHVSTPYLSWDGHLAINASDEISISCSYMLLSGNINEWENENYIRIGKGDTELEDGVYIKSTSSSPISITSGSFLNLKAAFDFKIESSDGLIESTADYLSVRSYSGLQVNTEKFTWNLQTVATQSWVQSQMKRVINIPVSATSFVQFEEDMINHSATSYQTAILAYLTTNNITAEDLYNSEVTLLLSDSELSVDVAFRPLTTVYGSDMGYSFVFAFLDPYPAYQGQFGFTEGEVILEASPIAGT